MKKLIGKNALVTGAGSGIGRAIAVRLAHEGAHVCVHYNSSEAGALDTVKQIEEAGGHAFALGADLADEHAIAPFFAKLQERCGSIDILINNAGAALERKPFLETDDKFWQDAFQINVMSTVRCSRVALPGMLAKNWGRIINISSISVRTGTAPNSLHYTTMKGAINGFTKALANETAPHGITVNAIAPGYIWTPFQVKTPGVPPKEMAKRIPAGRVGVPEDIAPLAAFLAGDEASYITGEVYFVTGGR